MVPEYIQTRAEQLPATAVRTSSSLNNSTADCRGAGRFNMAACLHHLRSASPPRTRPGSREHTPPRPQTSFGPSRELPRTLSSDGPSGQGGVGGRGGCW